MKPQDNLKTQTPTEVLDRAMLGILKVGAPFLSDAPSSSTTSAETGLTSRPQSQSFRDELIEEILSEKQGLTREELDQGMREMGF